MKPACLIDVSRLIGRASDRLMPTGIDRVSLAYIRRWGNNAQAIIHRARWRRVVSPGTSQQLFNLLVAPPPDVGHRIGVAIAKACIPPWPKQDAAGNVCFYLGHAGLEVPGFGHWLRATRQKPVFFIHDLIPMTHPEYCRSGEQAAHTARLKLMLEAGAGVLTNSQETMDELARFARREVLDMPPAAVAPLAPAFAAPAQAERPLLDKPYFVVLGTIEPRKNHLLLLQVWRALAARLGAGTPHLVVIGRRGWECENIVDLLERCDAIRPFVHEIAECPDELLAAYLQHANALLFPSFAEGYGMPLVEALMLGTPVIASDLPVFREVAGDTPDFIDPLDGAGWMHAIGDFASENSAMRSAQIRRMRTFEVPSWERHFAQVDRLLERIA